MRKGFCIGNITKRIPKTYECAAIVCKGSKKGKGKRLRDARVRLNMSLACKSRCYRLYGLVSQSAFVNMLFFFFTIDSFKYQMFFSYLAVV
jgi:hypothetical protein